MLLKPKHIEPGWARRWPREAAALVGENFHMWFAAMLALTVIGVFVAFLPFDGVIFLLLGVFSIKLSQELALAAEHKQVAPANFTTMIAEAARATIPEIGRNKFFVTFLVFLSIYKVAAISGMLGAETAKVWPQGFGSSMGFPSLAELVFDWPPLLRAGGLYCFGVMAAHNPAIGGTLVYPLQRMHGVSFEQAERLVLLGGRRNMKMVLALDGAIFLGAMILLVFLPIMLPFFLVFGPAVSYVACREMFGTGGPLHAKQTQTKSSFNLQKA